MSIRPAKSIVVGLIVGTLVGLASLGVVRHRVASPAKDTDTLDYIKHLVWLNNWADAAESLERLEARSALDVDDKTAVFCLAVRLRGRVESGRLDDVAKQLRALLKTRVAASDTKLRFVVLSALGDVLFQYDLQGAESVWQQTNQLASQRGDPVWEARSQGELGTIAFLNGDVLRALRLVSSAALKAETNDDVASQIRYRTALGEGLAKFGRKPDALNFFDRALRLHAANPGAYFPFTAFLGKAKLLAEAGKTSEAEQMLRSELVTAHKRGYRVREVRLLTALSDLLIQTGRPQEAHEQLKRAADLAGSTSMYRIESDVTTKLADVMLKAEGADGALPFAIRSVEAAERAGEVYSLPQKVAVLAEVQAASGRIHDAESNYGKASQLIDNLLRTVPYKHKSTLVGTMGRVFVGHFELTAVKLNDPAKAFHVVETARARGLLEMVRSSRKESIAPGSAVSSTQLVALHSQLASEPSPAARRVLLDRLWETEVRSFRYTDQPRGDLPGPNPVRLKAFQSILKPNELMIQYILGEEMSFALEIGRGHVKTHRLAPRQLIEDEVDRYLQTARNLGETASAARELYRLLLQPIARFQLGHRIVIVPDGKLHGLPFDALVEPSGGYVVARSIISYAPSASVNFLLSRSNNRGLRGKALLAIGGVNYGGDRAADKLRLILRSGGLFEAETPPALVSLPGSSKEISEVASLVGRGADQLKGDEATEAALKALNLAQYRAIHFAVHASIDEQFPDRSALRLAKHSGLGQDGLLQAREVLNLPLNADMVTLSACDAGSGTIEGLAGMNSLVQAFLMAGARTVVASTWPAEDNVTAELMRNFYSHLKIGADKAEALTLAKRDLLAKYGVNTQPFFWAGFRLVGDPHGTLGGD